jgi:hypothetical protein
MILDHECFGGDKPCVFLIVDATESSALVFGPAAMGQR